MLDLVFLIVSYLVILMFLVLPLLFMLGNWVCELIDENEHSFQYPRAVMLPWIRYLEYHRFYDSVVVCMLLSTVGVSLIIIQHTEGGIGIMCSVAIVIGGSVYGLYWLGRYFLRRKKKIKKTFDTLKGE